MLSDLQSGLQRLLYERGQIDASNVDIRFEAPTRAWVESLTQPTIDMFLFDLEENTEKRQTQMEQLRADRRFERRLPPRRIDLSYMVTAFASEIEDEQTLLWRVLATLMKHPELPFDILPDSIRSLALSLPTRIRENGSGGSLLEVWNALETPPHAALCYVVTAPLDLDFVFSGPLVLTRTARYRTLAADKLHATRIQIGGVVRDKQGRPLAGITVRLADSAAEGSITDEDGKFVLKGVPSGPVKLNLAEKGQAERRIEVNVPADSYEVVLEH